ncbi:MAG TPA: class I SAM-dependent methyltransferase [Candidatus Methylacidiphilales bacterium]
MQEPQQERTKVRAMFDQVAPRYDFLNRLLSGGRDRAWRRALTREVSRSKPKRLLDLATGSGDVLRALRDDGALAEGAVSLGADFCLPMLEEARKKGIGPLVLADGLRLPFADESFEAVTIAFGFRNLEDREAGLREIHRVLAPGGRLHVLEFSHPAALLAPFYFFYLKRVLPTVAACVGAPKEAYAYLGDSIRAFPGQARLAEMMRACGFAEARWRSLTFGIVALHTATK